MSATRRLLLLSLLLLFGCRGDPVQQQTDRILLEMARRPFDRAPPEPDDDKANAARRAGSVSDVKASDANDSGSSSEEPEMDVRTVALMQMDKPAKPQPKLEIPAGIPGAESVSLDFFQRDKEGKIIRGPDGNPLQVSGAEKLRRFHKFYPELGALPEPPTPQSGPSGVAYTLADFQKMAVQNSPTLRQAASDVKAAEGAVIQAMTYSNPTFAPLYLQPNNNNSAAGAWGAFLQQPIPAFGKKKMQVAAARKNLENYQLALRRARSDLSTSVRTAYFALIVAQESMRVNRALAGLSDEIYRLYLQYFAGTLAASYEPAPLRAQSYANRLAYQQAITTYIFAWQQLVAAIGMPHLPLTEVFGRADRFIPYYDYDKVKAYVLAHHTDMLTAQNGVQIAQYNLKLAQITPFGDFDLQYGINKETTLAPFVYYHTFQIGMPLPIFDQNRGNIISAKAALIRALEESHRVEMALTGTLAANYTNYQNNLYALEAYRRYILPDQVRYYRGAFERRQADPAAATAPPTDLVTAQQLLSANVQTYLGILGAMWSAVVSVADSIQTPDLFQLAATHELPETPDLTQMPQWLCPHQRAAAGPAAAVALPCVAGPSSPPAQEPAGDAVLPAPRPSGSRD